MLASAGFQMIHHLDEELRQVSLRKYWWRYVQPEPEPVRPSHEAEVIELAFGSQCEVEEPLGA
jgi:hypothetical protein